MTEPEFSLWDERLHPATGLRLWFAILILSGLILVAGISITVEFEKWPASSFM